MKRIILSGIILAALFTGCSSDEPKLDFCDNELSNVMSKRTIDDAISIADQYASNVGSSSRSTALKVDKSNISAIVSTTSRALSDTLMYVVNYEDNNGYLIISASKATEPILAIIDSGNYQEDEQVNVEGFDYFMDAAISYVANADGVNGSDDDGPIDKIMEWYSDTLVLTNPAKPWKVEVCWGQYWPENIYCPNKIAGCSPVAIAQVLSYFKPEMSFDLTFDGRPYDHLTINWDEILKHNISTQSTNKSLSHLFSCDASSATHEELAALVRQIGVWANSEYKSNTTSTPISQKFYVVERFLTDYSKIYVRSGEIYDKLQDGGIALVSGWGKEVSHAWVIDGTASIIYRITHYTYYIPKTGEYATKEFKQETAKYLHCNWGWCGSSNGYFLEGVFDTKTGRDFPILQPADPGDLGTLSVSSRNEYDCVDGYIYK